VGEKVSRGSTIFTRLTSLETKSKKCFKEIIDYLEEWNYFFQLNEVWGWISSISQLSNYTCVFFHLKDSYEETHCSTFEGTVLLPAQAKCYFLDRHL
jgi:hypothetical protein